MVVTSLWVRTSTTRFILVYPSGSTFTVIPKIFILAVAITVVTSMARPGRSVAMRAREVL